MMNVLGLSLVIGSLAAAGVFTPDQKQGHNTIVKEGRRVVVVEYDQGGHHNTKISISPEQEQEQEQEQPTLLPYPKELICDAYGKCKHKFADAMEKTKDKAHEALHKKKEEVHATKEAARHAAHTVSETVQTTKDHVAGNVSDARETLRHAFNRLLVGIGSHSLQRLRSLTGLANLLGFATAYGTCVWVTFISSYVQSRAMPRHQFAVLQSKIYPVYFRLMSYCIVLALLGHVLGHRNILLSNSAHLFQLYNLLASLLTLLLNSLYLEPRATKLMFERIKIEKEEGRGSGDPKEPSITAEQDPVRSRIIKLNDRLKKLNSYSSLLNIVNLMSLTWHLVYLAQPLHPTC